MTQAAKKENWNHNNYGEHNNSLTARGGLVAPSPVKEDESGGLVAPRGMMVEDGRGGGALSTVMLAG